MLAEPIVREALNAPTPAEAELARAKQAFDAAKGIYKAAYERQDTRGMAKALEPLKAATAELLRAETHAALAGGGR